LGKRSPRTDTTHFTQLGDRADPIASIFCCDRSPGKKGSIKPVQPIAGKAISTDCGSLRQKIPGTEFLFQMH